MQYVYLWLGGWGRSSQAGALQGTSHWWWEAVGRRRPHSPCMGSRQTPEWQVDLWTLRNAKDRRCEGSLSALNNHQSCE